MADELKWDSVSDCYFKDPWHNCYCRTSFAEPAGMSRKICYSRRFKKKYVHECLLLIKPYLLQFWENRIGYFEWLFFFFFHKIKLGWKYSRFMGWILISVFFDIFTFIHKKAVFALDRIKQYPNTKRSWGEILINGAFDFLPLDQGDEYSEDSSQSSHCSQVSFPQLPSACPQQLMYHSTKNSMSLQVKNKVQFVWESTTDELFLPCKGVCCSTATSLGFHGRCLSPLSQSWTLNSHQMRGFPDPPLQRIPHVIFSLSRQEASEVEIMWAHLILKFQPCGFYCSGSNLKKFIIFSYIRISVHTSQSKGFNPSNCPFKLHTQVDCILCCINQINSVNTKFSLESFFVVSMDVKMKLHAMVWWGIRSNNTPIKVYYHLVTQIFLNGFSLFLPVYQENQAVLR